MRTTAARALLLGMAAAPAQRAADDVCVPLIDLGTGTYRGCEGGLYPGGANEPPPAHLAAALARAAEVAPRDADGRPDPERGLIGFLGLGASIAAHEFAAFERAQDANPHRNPRLVLLNAAQAGEVAREVADPEAAYWRLVDKRVAAAGLAPAQVQVVWIEPTSGGARGFPRHAEALRDHLIAIVRILAERFPHLRLCYFSDRAYGGYRDGRGSEPAVYETGFAVKWLIEGQLAGRPALNHDPERGPVRAPLLLWGPYLWADGERANGRGTRWLPEDYEEELAWHPSARGEAKVAALLGDFFASDPTAAPWFAGDAPRPLPIAASKDAHVDGARPDVNLGSEATLCSAGGKLPQIAFVEFDLSSVARPVLHAKLSFRNPEATGSFLRREVRAVAPGEWDEAAVTFADAPAVGEVIGGLPRTSRDGTRALDVTAAVNARRGGKLTVAMTAEPGVLGTSAVLARESGRPPRLVLIEEVPR